MALPLSLLVAVLGFSYALATYSTPAVSDPAAAKRGRAAENVSGVTPRFTNPFLLPGADPKFPQGGQAGNPQGFDLGDVIYGSEQIWSRYLTATGGYVPYNFATRANFDYTVGSGQVPVPLPTVVPFGNGLVVGDSGVLSMISFGSGVFASGAIRFNALLKDVIGTQTTGTFRLNVVPPLTSATPRTSFRFAVDQLPTAQLGCDYFTKLDTLGGIPPVTYQLAVAPQVLPTGASFASLEGMGLALTADGILYGRPSIPLASGGTTNQGVGFTIVAQDSTGAQAFSRSGAQVNQPYILVVEPTASANSEVLAQSVRITNGKSLDSSLNYVGSFDPKGATLSTLAGTAFTLRIGTAKFTGTFDAKGKIVKLLDDTQTAVPCTITVSPQTLKVAIKIPSASLKTAIQYQNRGTTLPVIFSYEFYHYRACEALSLAFSGRGSRFELSYRLGGTGQSLSGGCQVLHATGMDQFSMLAGNKGVRGDAWVVRWMSVPRFAIDAGAATAFPVPKSTTAPSSVSVTITLGASFTQTVTATLQSVLAVFLSTTPGDGIYKLKLDGRRFTHLLQTYSISEDDTAIPEALRMPSPTVLHVGMSLTGYQGDCGKLIAPLDSTWSGR